MVPSALRYIDASCGWRSASCTLETASRTTAGASALSSTAPNALTNPYRPSAGGNTVARSRQPSAGNARATMTRSRMDSTLRGRKLDSSADPTDERGGPGGKAATPAPTRGGDGRHTGPPDPAPHGSNNSRTSPSPGGVLPAGGRPPPYAGANDDRTHPARPGVEGGDREGLPGPAGGGGRAGTKGAQTPGVHDSDVTEGTSTAFIRRDRLAREAEEAVRLAPAAQRSADLRGRATPEPPDEFRTAFERDRDRILHAKAFRRLKHKTQVFLNPEGDHYITRLSHTLQVTQIARSLAAALSLNESLAEAIALGHDVGHSPFGHTGEEALSPYFPTSGGWHHAAQSVRVLSVLEPLNLSWEVLDGIRAHSWKIQPPPATQEAFCVRYATGSPT